MVFSMFTRSNKNDDSNKNNDNKSSFFGSLPNVNSNDKNIDNSLKVIKDIVKGNRAKFDNRNIDIDDNIYKYQSPKPPEKSSNSNSSSVRGPRPVYDSNYSPYAFQYQESRYQDSNEQKQQNDDYYNTRTKKVIGKGSKVAYSPRSSSSTVPKNKIKAKVPFDINANLTTMIAAWKIKYFVTLIQKKTIKLESQKQIRYLNRELDKRTAQLNTINGKYSTEKNALLIELDKHMSHEAEINKELGELRQHHDDFRNHNSELVSLVKKIDNKKIDEKNADLQDLIDSYKREIQAQIEQVGKLNIYKDLHEREVSKSEVLKTELEVTRKTCQELIFKLSSNEVELDVRRMSESQKEKELNKEINNLKGVIKLQEKELQDNYDRIEGLEKALIDFRDGIEITVRDLKQNFKSELGSKQDEITGLLQQIEAMKLEKERENANMMGSLAQQMAELKVKEREISKDLSTTFDEERRDLLGKISAANVETLEVINERNERDKIIDEMNRLLVLKDDDIKNLKKQYNQVMKDKVVVQDIIETIAGKAKTFETEKDTLQGEVDRLHHEIGKGEVLIQSLQDSFAALEKRLQISKIALERSYMKNEDNEENLRVTNTALVNTSGYCRFIEEQLFMARKGGEVIGVIASKSSNGKVKTQDSKSFLDSFGFLPSNVIDENQESMFSANKNNGLSKPLVKGVENISTLENRLSNLIATLEDKLYPGSNEDGNYSNIVDIANTVTKADTGVKSGDDNSKQMKREAKEKVDNIRLELQHDVNLCLEYIEEIHNLSTKREKIKSQIVRWEQDFFGLTGRKSDTADKKRSNVFSSICTEFMQVQRIIRDKYEECQMLLAQVADIYIHFDEARGVVETLTGKKPEDFKYNIVLPDESLIENPYLNRKTDEERNVKRSIVIEENKSNSIEEKDHFITTTISRPSNNMSNAIKKVVTLQKLSKPGDKSNEDISKISNEIKEFETFVLKISTDIDLLKVKDGAIDMKVEEWIKDFKKGNNNREPSIRDKKGIAIFDDQLQIKKKLMELQKQLNTTNAFLLNSKLAFNQLSKKTGAM